MFGFPQASVDHDRQLLKRKETETERQQDMFQRIVRMKGIIYIFDKKIIIFKIKQNSQIQENAGPEPDTIQRPASRGICRNQRKQETQYVIQADTGQNDCQIIYVEITVKPQRHAG